MIVKFNRRGVGGGSGPIGYLLGRNRDREHAQVLRGDAEQTRELIDASAYAKRYTSGVLSFHEADLPDDAKREIMDSFERALLPGLDGDQYDCLWVEHRDKGRLELNFVVPNIELTSGKRLQPYYDRADRPRIDAWKVLANAEHGLHDPDDPANQRALTYPSNLPRDRVQAQREITNGLLGLAEHGEITNRADVVSALEGAGFTVTRQAKTSISIADPESGKPLRLRGKLYERDFKNGDGLRGEIEAASREYRAGRQERVREARERLAIGVERKREENQRRYRRPEPEAAKDRAHELVGRAYTGIPDFAVGRGGPVVDGSEHRRQSERDRALQREPGTVEGPRGRDPVQPLWGERQAVREDRSGRGSLRRQTDRGISLGDTGGLLSDRPREGAVTRLRAVTARLRGAAEGMAERLREFAEHVRGHQAGERQAGRPGADIKQAYQGLERASAGLEREGVALESRQREALRQRSRDRGPSLGL